MNINELQRPGLFKIFVVLTAAMAAGFTLDRFLSAGINFFVRVVEAMFLTGLLSMVFVYLVSPFVQMFEARGLRRLWAVTALYLLLALCILVLWLVAGPTVSSEFADLKQDIPVYGERFNGMFSDLLSRLREAIPYLRDYDFTTNIGEKVAPFAETALAGVTKSVFTVLSLMIFVPMFSFFLLLDGLEFKQSIYGMVPNRYFEMTMDMMNKINTQLRSFIRGRVIEAFFVGLTILIGLAFVQLKYLWFLAIFAGVANLVPYIGPIVGMAPGLLIALLELDSTGKIAWVFILYIVVAQIIVDTFILIPILISKVANLHPLVVFLAIIVGGEIQGVLGMIIAVPLVNIVSVIVRETYRYMFKRRMTFVR